jgi:hypothetical protein
MSDDVPNPYRWPEDGSPVALDDLLLPITEAITFAYVMERRYRDQDIPWDSFEISENAHWPSIKESFRAANLEYAEEDQGRDALDHIIIAAIMLGIEQGQRIAHTGLEYRAMKIMADTNSGMLREISAKAKEQGPFEKGAMAYRMGTPITANPYPAGSHDRADWALAWECARSSEAARKNEVSTS